MSEPKSQEKSRSFADEIVYFFVLAIFIGIVVVVISLYYEHTRIADLDFDHPITALQTFTFVFGLDALLYPAIKELAKRLSVAKIEVPHSNILLGLAGVVSLLIWLLISLIV